MGTFSLVVDLFSRFLLAPSIACRRQVQTTHTNTKMASITRIVMTNCSRNALAWRPASSAMWVQPATAATSSQQSPSLKQQLFSYAILGFALSEAMGLFCLMMAFLLL